MDIIHRGLTDIIDRQAQKINELQAKLDKAVEALKYYANRMDSGGTARAALRLVDCE